MYVSDYVCVFDCVTNDLPVTVWDIRRHWPLAASVKHWNTKNMHHYFRNSKEWAGLPSFLGFFFFCKCRVGSVCRYFKMHQPQPFLKKKNELLNKYQDRREHQKVCIERPVFSFIWKDSSEFLTVHLLNDHFSFDLTWLATIIFKLLNRTLRF